MKPSRTLPFAALLATLAFAAPAEAQLADAKILTMEATEAALDAALAQARTMGLNVSIAVVDAAGDLLGFRRMDGASLVSIDIAQGKARTSALMRAPTKALQDRLATGTAAALLTVPGLVMLEGAVPIAVNGTVVGAIGVSGASSADDAEIASAGAAAVRP